VTIFMRFLATAVFFFLLGGASVVAWHIFSQPKKTEVWVAKSDIFTTQGSKISAGTEFVVEQYMAEGFVALNLVVNVEATDFSAFEVKEEPYQNLRIPVWLQTQFPE
jgi:hypothetical protein